MKHYEDRGGDSALKESRSRLDRAAIAIRSDRNRGVLPRDFCAVRLESDAPGIFRKEKKIGLHVAIRSRSRGLNVDENKLSSCRHVAIGEPSDRRHLNPSFAYVMNLMIAWTRVQAISAVPTESNIRRASTSPAKGKTVWEHSPTRRKIWEISQLNWGAPLTNNCVTAPQLLPRPTLRVGPPLANPHTPRGAPHGRPRGLLPRVSATCASRGPPGLYHVASVPHRTSRWSSVPRQRLPHQVITYR